MCLLGIPHGSRAKAEMFSGDGMKGQKANSYPSIGQKKLNGAAARLMIHFMGMLASEHLSKDPSDLNRPQVLSFNLAIAGGCVVLSKPWKRLRSRWPRAVVVRCHKLRLKHARTHTLSTGTATTAS